MWRAWKLGSAFGIDLYLHWSFFLAPLFAFVQQWTLSGDVASAGFLAAVVLCVFVCIVPHELGHALAARYFGIGTRDITLYPIGGLARLERMSERPHEELVIALAGPAVNVVIALLLAAVLGLGLLLDPAFVVGTVPGLFVFWVMLGNLALVAFNMIPAFPTDGGRVFRALLAMRLGQLNATRIAAWLGGVLAIVLLAVGVLMWSPVIPVLAIFLFLAGQQELHMLERRRRKRVVRQFAVEEEAVPAEPAHFRLPRVTTYVWDADTGQWVRQPESPFYRS